ncbi:MAG: hypothetical protein SFX73_36075 [Kofleriaceae bacterium]|nr:hypothetical protein [Kofleriaceae bacterium]
MTNRKATFAKRQRETDLKDKAKAKEARLAARRANAGKGGPPIDWAAQAPTEPTGDETELEGESTETPPPPTALPDP